MRVEPVLVVGIRDGREVAGRTGTSYHNRVPYMQ